MDDTNGVLVLVTAVFLGLAVGLFWGFQYAQSQAAVTWFRETAARERRRDENVERVKREYRARAAAHHLEDAVLEEDLVIDEEYPERL